MPKELEHVHRWRKVYEESLIGGAFQTGWECEICREYHSIYDITPDGLQGITLKTAARLVGPHGGRGNTSGGDIYKEQIVDEDGTLTIR